MAALLVVLCALVAGVAAQLSVPGNSTFDAQINQILHWDSLHQSNLGLAPNAIAAAAVAIGIVITFYGFTLLRPVIFVTGFLVGAVAGFIGAAMLLQTKPYVVTACWAAFALGGLLCGILLTVLFGVLAIVLERPFVIFALSAFGAIMITWGIGYFAGGYPNATSLPQSLKNGTVSVDIPYSWWGYVVGTVVLCILGMYFQQPSPPLKMHKRFVHDKPFIHC
ncbi:hypothetical protein SPRG_13467 [Saprolegnia parasitica CBS 223.65]|uniref:Transmembrane protein 198 n=1 Tax=Saprolegnia parasitica (strain CBS 223.65) TaxID=695850 RepID=A0A067BPQ4_SAPPC|nr:hypothetical protein SPRG_13467 [Saprolegnia parasitica CBS 223.65]KDO20213.1 hypothetical protein SPRG_13467 [Saprolegnia parasitica CBS 223.65]|eukprot:XP_012209100.1 hypothetical protein SPRG_13467 [Saprolegnia parasitica CBS 223.65]